MYFIEGYERWGGGGGGGGNEMLPESSGSTSVFPSTKK